MRPTAGTKILVRLDELTARAELAIKAGPQPRTEESKAKETPAEEPQPENDAAEAPAVLGDEEAQPEAPDPVRGDATSRERTNRVPKPEDSTSDEPAAVDRPLDETVGDGDSDASAEESAATESTGDEPVAAEQAAEEATTDEHSATDPLAEAPDPAVPDDAAAVAQPTADEPPVVAEPLAPIEPAANNFSVTPASQSVVAGSTNDFTWTFRATNSANAAGLIFTIPAAWTDPTTSAGPGQVLVTAGTCPASLFAIIGDSVIISQGGGGGCDNNETFTLQYRQATAPTPGTLPQTYTFINSRGNDPTITVTAPPSADLSVTKSDSPDPVNAGGDADLHARRLQRRSLRRPVGEPQRHLPGHAPDATDRR